MRKYLILSITITFITLLFGVQVPAGTSEKDLMQVPDKVEKTYTYNLRGGGQKKICIEITSNNQCEVAVACPNEKLPEETELHTLLNQGRNFNITVPGQKCATFDLEHVSPTNPCHCSGRRCWC